MKKAAMVLFAALTLVLAGCGRDQETAQPETGFACEDGLLVITTDEYPCKATVYHDNTGMAYRLTGKTTYLPPVHGDGEYHLVLRTDGGQKEFGCKVTGSDQIGMFLSPTLSMEGHFNEIAANPPAETSLEEITSSFVTGFRYNHEPNEGIESPYTPDTKHTEELGYGSCADLTALYVLYLRSAGIPAKVVYGDRTASDGKKEAHAWSEVYTDGEWKIVDITLLCERKTYAEIFAEQGLYMDEYCIY